MPYKESLLVKIYMIFFFISRIFSMLLCEFFLTLVRLDLGDWQLAWYIGDFWMHYTSICKLI